MAAMTPPGAGILVDTPFDGAACVSGIIPSRYPGRGSYEITSTLGSLVRVSGIDRGLCNVFIHHISASLIIYENADPAVLEDLERFVSDLVHDGDRRYRHTQEGPDAMPAHVRSVLTATSLSIPVSGGACALGTWQGVFVWEHRARPHRRRVTVTVQGAE